MPNNCSNLHPTTIPPNNITTTTTTAPALRKCTMDPKMPTIAQTPTCPNLCKTCTQQHHHHHHTRTQKCTLNPKMPNQLLTNLHPNTLQHNRIQQSHHHHYTRFRNQMYYECRDVENGSKLLKGCRLREGLTLPPEVRQDKRMFCCFLVW